MVMLAVEEQRKEAIRRRILWERDQLSAEERLDKSNIISVRVVQTWEFQQAGSVMLYASFGSEVDTNWLMQATLEADKRLILPRVNIATHSLDLYYITDPAQQLAPGIWDIREPIVAQCEPTSLAEVDCVIAPGIAFDKWGGRLGYGGGYYDRLLNSLTAAQAHVSLGLGYELQIVQEIPVGFFDARVAVIATELRLVVQNR